MALVCVLPTSFIETNLHLGEVDPAVDLFIQLAQWKQRAGVARERYQELRKILHDSLHVELPSLRKKEAHLHAHTQIAPVWIPGRRSIQSIPLNASVEWKWTLARFLQWNGSI